MDEKEVQAEKIETPPMKDLERQKYTRSTSSSLHKSAFKTRAMLRPPVLPDAPESIESPKMESTSPISEEEESSESIMSGSLHKSFNLKPSSTKNIAYTQNTEPENLPTVVEGLESDRHNLMKETEKNSFYLSDITRRSDIHHAHSPYHTPKNASSFIHRKSIL